MRKFALIIGVLLLILTLSTPAFAKDLKLAYVTMEEVLNNYTLYIQEMNRIQKELSEKEKEVQASLDEYQRKLDELQGKMLNPMLSEEARAQAGEEYTQLMNEAFSYRDRELSQLDAWSQKQIQPVLEKVYYEIANIAEEEGYDFVFNESSSLVFANTIHNITQKVIDSLNAKATEETQTPSE